MSFEDKVRVVCDMIATWDAFEPDEEFPTSYDMYRFFAEKIVLALE